MKKPLFKYNPTTPPAVTACIHYAAVAGYIAHGHTSQGFLEVARTALSEAKKCHSLLVEAEAFYRPMLTAAINAAEAEITKSEAACEVFQ